MLEWIEGNIAVVVIVAFWSGVVLIPVLGGKRETRRIANRRPPVASSHELAWTCPNCGGHLIGWPITNERLAAGKPPTSWGVCANCGYERCLPVRYPWTKADGQIVEEAWRCESERQLIARYEREIVALESAKKRRLSSHLEGLLQMSPTEFEYAVADILVTTGYQNVRVCGGAGDLSVDIECVSPSGRKTAVQCKRYSDQPVGSKELQTFIGMLHRHHHRSGLYVTTSRFTKPAQELAKKHRIELLDGDSLGAKAAALAPPDAVDEDAEIANRRAALRELSMYEVVKNERLKAAQNTALQARRDRIRRARQYGRSRY